MIRHEGSHKVRAWLISSAVLGGLLLSGQVTVRADTAADATSTTATSQTATTQTQDPAAADTSQSSVDGKTGLPDVQALTETGLADQNAMSSSASQTESAASAQQVNATSTTTSAAQSRAALKAAPAPAPAPEALPAGVTAQAKISWLDQTTNQQIEIPNLTAAGIRGANAVPGTSYTLQSQVETPEKQSLDPKALAPMIDHYKFMNLWLVNGVETTDKPRFKKGETISVQAVYAPLANLYFQYVDEADPDKPLLQLKVPTDDSNEAGVAGGEHYDFSAYIPEIPGYEYDASATDATKLKGEFTEVKTADSDNDVIVKVMYKKAADYDPNVLPTVNGSVGWGSFRGSLSENENPTNETTPQFANYTYVGTTTHIMQSGPAAEWNYGLYYLPGESVTVKYQTADGTSLADDVVFTPDATTNPDGKWTASPEDITGYKLTKVSGAVGDELDSDTNTVSGTFNPLTRTVIYYYENPNATSHHPNHNARDPHSSTG